ncbi:MAG TPA: GNAT family N-acetyltransferase [Solirubrobacteraceae bacterium]|nr:GNAT family N-acetyltransferase [Solirubrobacteraceae bacterium]
MDLVELGALSDRDWTELIAGEHQPFGPDGAGLQWRAKDRHIGVRGAGGALVAVAGAVVATVEIEGGEAFEVVGLGSLIVTRSARGQGLMSRLLGPLLELASEIGPARAMLFCRPPLVAVYRELDFAVIAGPVFAEQPGGRVQVPMTAMWRALHGSPGWPAGRVEVHGLPF